MLKAFCQTDCHFYKRQAYRHAMLQKLTLIWIIAKSLSHAKSLELCPTRFCGKENNTLSPSLFPFPPQAHAPHQNTLLCHTEKFWVFQVPYDTLFWIILVLLLQASSALSFNSGLSDT